MEQKSSADEVRSFVITPIIYMAVAAIFLLLLLWSIVSFLNIPAKSFLPYSERIGTVTDFEVAIESGILSSTTYCLVEVNNSSKYAFKCHANDLSTSMCLYRHHSYGNTNFLEVDAC